jgi:hypothetical protein
MFGDEIGDRLRATAVQKSSEPIIDDFSSSDIFEGEYAA